MKRLEKKFKLHGKSEELAAVRSDLKELLLDWGLADKWIEDFILAVQETLTNVIRHAYENKGGTIEVILRNDSDRVEVVVEDQGKSFDSSKVKEPELPPRKPGGMGLYLIKRLMDEVQYKSSGNKNEWRLVKYKSSKG